MRINEIAAYIHRKMCTDNRFGYSWEERWGHTSETWTIDGKKYTVKVGDYDCSSSCITAWKTALQHTKYAHALDGATYTGNMREVFVDSGLFVWKPMSFLAAPGDLYLNEENHVAMCQTQTPDILSEFSWGDNGAYGNKRGDQSGNEAHMGDYYDYPWDGILHYNGKADNSTAHTTAPAQPRYRVKGILKWGAWKSCGQSALSKNGIYDIDFSGLPNGSWFRLRLKGGEWLPKNAHNKTKKPVIAITLYYATANPDTTGYYEIVYRARLKKNGAWLAWKVDDNHGGTSNGKDVLDCLQAKIRKC